MTESNRPRPSLPARLALFTLGGAAAGAATGASGFLRDLGPGPDAVSGAVYGVLVGAVAFVLLGRPRRP
jgi:membrane associated rhomboid family serine protease